MKRFSFKAGVLSLALLAAPAAWAQDRLPPVWEANIAGQLEESLSSKSPGIRAAAMQLIVELDRHRPDLDLSATVDPLLKIYGRDQDPSYRLMALSALHALDNEYGTQRLAELVRKERSPVVRRATLLALADLERR
ncbi:HEAT repeat domain-containing protein [Rhodocaloribacter litoris]|uniref:HEAT repeat domain-containing protein n=1 Tax=Rhodocaloribacter litoris TaxID=2558931 RepID=UPI0014248F4D|nr:HEAT repeat domain-containing protein [Rhodocaloribacter litoris]QXD16115.1 HEAT repeat domain-containing protein [Rhodocaloribacter litoris]GIV59849.1 MAG: hypothetical protein KatS3mg043_0938 [Rhodothermaceae bacterium]